MLIRPAAFLSLLCNGSSVDFKRYQNLTKQKEVAGKAWPDIMEEEGKTQMILTQQKEASRAGNQIYGQVDFGGRIQIAVQENDSNYKH